MKTLTSIEVRAMKVTELGLDPKAVDLTSVEALAGALRRMASLLCPCSEKTLRYSVTRPLQGLVDNPETVKKTVKEALKALIIYGDLLEYRDIENETASLLYVAPVRFVVRKGGVVLLLGIKPDHVPALPDCLEKHIEYENHMRRLHPLPDRNLPEELTQLGLRQLPYEDWLKEPKRETPEQHLSRINCLLQNAQPSRDVPGLLLLDPKRPNRYYSGRWTEVRSQTGKYIARRKQAYGADLWSYVELRNGNPERLIDLPIAGSRWRGCDEAWHLQMAIDATHGNAQNFRVTPGPKDKWVIRFFSPVPMWAQRRWDAVGKRVPADNCLFAYQITKEELAEELSFFQEALWLEELGDRT